MDLNQLLTDALSGITQTRDVYMDAANAVGKAANNTETVNLDAIKQARQDIPVAQGIAQGMADMDYQRNKLVQDTLKAAMLDPGAANNAYTQGMADLTALNMERNKAAAEVTNLSSVNLLDDPFGYIMAQINMPVATARLQGLDKQAEIVTNDVQTRLNIAKSAQSTLVADTADKAKELAYKNADMQARAAASKLDVAAADVQANAAAKVMTQADAIAKALGTKKDAYTLAASDEHWEQTRLDRIAQRDEIAEAKKARLAATTLAEEKRAAMQADLKLAYARLGISQVPDIETFIKSANTPQKKAISDIMNGGNFGASLALSMPTVITAGPDMQGLIKGGAAGFAHALQGINKTAAGYIEKAAQMDPTTGKTLKHSDALAVGYDKYQIDMEASTGNRKTKMPLTSEVWDSNFNVYKADHKRMIANKGDVLTNNVMMEAVKTLEPTIPVEVGKFRGIDEQQALMNIAAMVGKKTISLDVAAKQIADYYQTSARINQDFYTYESLGLPPQTSYMAAVKIPGFLGDTRVPSDNSVDLMNPVDVKRLLLGITLAKSPPAMTPLVPFGF